MWQMPDSIRAGDVERRGDVAAEDRGRQAVFGVVGDADRLVVALDADHRDDRAEATPRGRCASPGVTLSTTVAGMHRAVGCAAGERRVGALGDRVLDQVCDARRRRSRSTTAPSTTWPSRGSPTGSALGLGGELRDEGVGDLLVDDDPLGRHADLALVHEGAEGGGLDRLVEIGVVEHDQRRLAAELEQHRLEVAAARLGDDAADPGRAGEVDAPHGRMGDQRLDDLGGDPRARW